MVIQESIMSKIIVMQSTVDHILRSNPEAISTIEALGIPEQCQLFDDKDNVIGKYFKFIDG